MATNNGLNLALSGQTGTGSFVGSASPTFTGTPVLSTASATSLTFTSTSGIIGTTTNNSAAAGSVGEYIEAVIPRASAIAISDSVPITLTSISLTAGDWDVEGNVLVIGNPGSTTISQVVSCMNTTTNTLNTDNSYLGVVYPVATINTEPSCAAPIIRYSLASTTTIYLVLRSTFAAGTATAYGRLRARRIR